MLALFWKDGLEFTTVGLDRKACYGAGDGAPPRENARKNKRKNEVSSKTRMARKQLVSKKMSSLALRDGDGREKTMSPRMAKMSPIKLKRNDSINAGKMSRCKEGSLASNAALNVRNRKPPQVRRARQLKRRASTAPRLKVGAGWKVGEERFIKTNPF